MRKIWCMNLIDNRNEGERNKDDELKFRLCKEKGMIAIGWGVSGVINSWQEYLKSANEVWKSDKNFVAGINALEEMSDGDLVWIKNPVSDDVYIAEIVDKSADPSIYSNLMEFDICAYRKCRYLYVNSNYLTGSLCKKHLSARRAIEKMRDSARQDTIDATLTLFEKLEDETNENH